ncbi:MAG: hypothetical protein M1839_006264 [Geoglossum umbratile]|nr:MAG: hypothetical protein M1839_006264 [Geoglossum umbratile]
MDDTAEANQLSDFLGPYAKDPASRSRADHLITLCETGARIKQMTDRHPSNWTFGSWESRQGAVIQFPSVLKDQQEVMPAEYE